MKGNSIKKKDGKRTTTFPTHILFIMQGRENRSLNYWLPSAVKIPACQARFLLGFGQSPFDGLHFRLTRTRRCWEYSDT